jgi:predicted transcriptional regulator
MKSFRRLPPLNALRSYEAAARHLSFTRAAGELSVTPAAVSHQVKMLRRSRPPTWPRDGWWRRSS